jgi:hypothetical protein
MRNSFGVCSFIVDCVHERHAKSPARPQAHHHRQHRCRLQFGNQLGTPRDNFGLRKWRGARTSEATKIKTSSRSDCTNIAWVPSKRDHVSEDVCTFNRFTTCSFSHTRAHTQPHTTTHNHNQPHTTTHNHTQSWRFTIERVAWPPHWLAPTVLPCVAA